MDDIQYVCVCGNKKWYVCHDEYEVTTVNCTKCGNSAD
jgi:hypothetical protein